MSALFPAALGYLVIVLLGHRLLRALAAYLGAGLGLPGDVSLIFVHGAIFLLLVIAGWLIARQAGEKVKAASIWDTHGANWLNWIGPLLVVAVALALLFSNQASVESALIALAGLSGLLGAAAMSPPLKSQIQRIPSREDLALAGPVTPVPDGSTRKITCRFRPAYDLKPEVCEIIIPPRPADSVPLVSVAPPSSPAGWYGLVKEQFTPELRITAAQIRQLSEEHQWTNAQEAELVAEFAAALPSDTATATTPSLRRPAELLFSPTIRAAERVLLAASLLYALGHEVGLFVAAAPGSSGIALAYSPENLTEEDSLASPLCMSSSRRRYYYLNTLPEHSADAEVCGTVGAIFWPDNPVKPAILLPIV